MSLLPLLLVVTLHAQAPARPLAAVVIMSKEPVPTSALDAIGAKLTRRLQDSGRFLRVTHQTDILTSLGVDLRKDISTCPDAACMVKTARPLGVDQLFLGMVQRVPAGLVLSVRALDVKTAAVLAKVDEPLPGEAVGGWSKAVEDTGSRLLGEPVTPVPAAAPVEKPAAEVPAAEPETPRGSSPLLWVGRGISVVGLLGLGVSLVVTLASAAVAAGVYLVFTHVAGFDSRRTVMQGLYLAGLGGVGAGVVMLVLMGLVGIAGGMLGTRA